MVDWGMLNCTIVCYAGDGMEALRQIPSFQPDIIFTDVVMPRMNGLELLRAINTAHPWIKTILISAYDEREYIHTALRNDAVDYLIKPFSREEITEVVRRVIAKINDEQIRLPKDDKVGQERLVQAKERISAISRLLSMRDTVAARQQARLLLDEVLCLADGSRMMTVSVCLDLLLSAYQVLNTLSPGRRAADGIEEIGFLSRTKNIADLAMKTEQVFGVVADKIDSDSSPVSILVHGAKKLVEERMAEGITIRRIADLLEISTNYLQAVFKQETGVTLHQFIISARMEHAKKLLLTTSKPVYEISGEVGYRDKDYFARVFAASTGHTPQEYRKHFS